jgi:phage terminase large subunit-like protein
MWIKANPNLDVSVDAAKLESTIQKARGIPSQWVEMLTKRFNIWCQGSTPWMGAGAWDACALDYEEAIWPEWSAMPVWTCPQPAISPA